MKNTDVEVVATSQEVVELIDITYETLDKVGGGTVGIWFY